MQLASWSPDGRSLVLVHDNDLFYVKDVRRPTRVQRLTSTGRSEVVYNGVADWLYEGKGRRLISRGLTAR